MDDFTWVKGIGGWGGCYGRFWLRTKIGGAKVLNGPAAGLGLEDEKIKNTGDGLVGECGAEGEDRLCVNGFSLFVAREDQVRGAVVDVNFQGLGFHGVPRWGRGVSG